MDNLAPEIRECYEYALKLYAPKDNIEGAEISELDVMKAHFLIADYFHEEKEIVMYGIKNFDLMSSAVSRQVTGFGGVLKWENDYLKMASLFYGLTKNHAFEDGNKRTALLTLLLYMYRVGLMISCKKEKLEALAVNIAAGTLEQNYGTYKAYKGDADADVRFIAGFLKKNTRKGKPVNRSMTYAEFNAYLKEFDVWMDDSDRGFINVYQKKAVGKRGFFVKKQEIVKTVKVLSVSFRGWKRQVMPRTIKKVLVETGLTIENGFDREVILKNAEPLYALIEEYREPLQRLKDN